MINSAVKCSMEENLRGYFQIRRLGGGLGPHIKFGGKIWSKVRPSSTNKRKNLGSSVTTRRKSWKKVPFLGSYLKFRGQNLGYLSLIFLEAKLGLQQQFQRRQAPPPRPPDMEVPSGSKTTGQTERETEREQECHSMFHWN